jgi:NADPH:quinone reductase-like Zn-dependent oxidoreductase
LTIPQDAAVAHLPKSLSFEEGAALLFGGTTALYFLRDLGKITKGESILIIGASGAVGTNAVQLAKHFGAKVTGVCSAKNAPLVKSLGADQVIDYHTQPLELYGPYDMVLNAAQELSVDALAKLVRPGGKVLLVLSDLLGMLQSSLLFLQSAQAKKVKFLNGTAPERKEDVQLLTELAASGKLKAVIDKEYTFDEIVDAHRYVDTGRKVGNVIVRV